MKQIGKAAQAVAVSVLLAGLMTGCVATTKAKPKETSSPEVRCAAVEIAKDCGGVGSLEDASKEERGLVIAGDPESSPALAEIARKFADQYDLKVTWILPNLTTAQRLEITASSGYSGPQPDVFELDPGSEPPPADRVAPYRVTDFEQKIPATRRDGEGRWVQDFGGIMMIGYNQTVLGTQSDASFVSRPVKSGALSVAGDVTQSSSAAHAVAMLAQLAGTPQDGRQGLNLLADQRISRTYTSLDSVESGAQTVVIDWSYRQAYFTAKMKKRDLAWRYLVPQATSITGWHGMAINAKAANPATARLWEEWVFIDASQNALLKARAMPTAYDYLLLNSRIAKTSRRYQPVALIPPVTPTPAMLTALRTDVAPVWGTIFTGK